MFDRVLNTPLLESIGINGNFPAGIYLLKVKSRILEQGVGVVLMSLYLTLNIFHTLL